MRLINSEVTSDDAKHGELKAGRTAIHRSKLSLPVRRLLKKNLIRGRVLDYGCGHGSDVMELTNAGVFTEGYDPNHMGWKDKPDAGRKFDTVLCNYVLNVVTVETEHKIIEDIKGLLREGGCAYITVRRDLEHSEVITTRGTYQRIVKLPFEEVDKSSGAFITYRLSN